MPKEIIFQQDMFTGELVDNRTRTQKCRDNQLSQPRQLEMFPSREVAQFGVRANPTMPLSPNVRLFLQMEDPRTDEEKERDRQREAEDLTQPMFAGEQPCEPLRSGMGWIAKDKPTPVDELPIQGLVFLIGDMVAEATGNEQVRGHKYPIVMSPSGRPVELWDETDPEAAKVTLFGEMALPYAGTASGAFRKAREIAQEHSYEVHMVDEETLEIWGPGVADHFLVVYDNQARRMAEVWPIRAWPDEASMRSDIYDNIASISLS